MNSSVNHVMMISLVLAYRKNIHETEKGAYRARTLKLLLKFIKDLLKVASLVSHGVEHELFESLVDLLNILIAVGVVGAGVCEDYLNDRRELLLEYGLNELLRSTLTKL